MWGKPDIVRALLIAAMFVVTAWVLMHAAGGN